MPIQVLTDHRAEMMATDIYVYLVETDPPRRMVMRPDGNWREAGPAGTVAQPTWTLPDDIVPLVVRALGIPQSDAHLTDALRVERARVDKLMDTMAEAVTRGL